MIPLVFVINERGTLSSKAGCKKKMVSDRFGIMPKGELEFLFFR